MASLPLLFFQGFPAQPLHAAHGLWGGGGCRVGGGWTRGFADSAASCLGRRGRRLQRTETASGLCVLPATALFPLLLPARRRKVSGGREVSGGCGMEEAMGVKFLGPPEET